MMQGDVIYSSCPVNTFFHICSGYSPTMLNNLVCLSMLMFTDIMMWMDIITRFIESTQIHCSDMKVHLISLIVFLKKDFTQTCFTEMTCFWLLFSGCWCCTTKTASPWLKLRCGSSRFTYCGDITCTTEVESIQCHFFQLFVLLSSF